MKLSSGIKLRLSCIRSVCKNENGAVLVIGLMFLAILALLGTTAVVMTTTDMQIGANYKTSVQASNVAEAGINEAIHRMNLGSTETNYIGEASGIGPTPGWGRYVVLQSGVDKFKDDPNWNLSSDSLDNDGDSTVDESNEAYPEIATVQTIDGNELNYLVRVNYKIEDAQFNNGTVDDELVLYGQDFGYGSQAPVVGTHPVWIFTSIGSSASNVAKATIIGEATRFPLDISAKAALACEHPPLLGGGTLVSGFDHDLSTTPADSGRSDTDITGADLSLDGNARDNHGGPERYDATNYTDHDTHLQGTEDTDIADPRLDEVTIMYGSKIENGAGTYLPGVWTTGNTVTQSGTDDIYGGNSMEPWKNEDVANTWLELNALLGISPDELQTILDKADVTMDDTTVSGGNLWLNVAPVGVTYIDNATSSTLKFSSAVIGSGLMYVTGDLDANNLQFKGLIYVEGSVTLSASFWLLGALAVKGVDPVGSGGGQILYSKDALDHEVGNAMKFVFLSLGDESLMP